MTLTAPSILSLPESPRILKRIDGKRMQVTRAMPVGPRDEFYGRIMWDQDSVPWHVCVVDGRRVRCRMGQFE